MVSIREAQKIDSTAIAKVHVDSWLTTYKGIVPNAHLASLSYEDRDQAWQEFFSGSDLSQFIYVAEDASGQIIGFACGGPNRDRDSVYVGELYAIYLLQRHQHQGIGRKLTLTVAKRLQQQRMNSMLVWVLAENPACAFYESLGGQRVSEQEINIGGMKLLEVSYGWPDLSVLMSGSK